MTARLTWICHAATAAVRGAAFPADEPIEARGLAAARALAPRLPHADRAWASPLLRAQETAIALGLAAVPEAALRECDHGRWAGRTLAAVSADEPEAFAQWVADPSSAPHGGETLVHLLQRVGIWLDQQREATGTTTIVTHAAVIRAAVVHALSAPPRSFWRLDVAPLSLTRLSWAGDHWRLSSLGPAHPGAADG